MGAFPRQTDELLRVTRKPVGQIIAVLVGLAIGTWITSWPPGVANVAYYAVFGLGGVCLLHISTYLVRALHRHKG